MPTSRAEAQAGFTLLELLVVLVILALAATAVMRLGAGGRETAEVRAFLMRAEAMMREARTTAVSTRQETEVVIDTQARRLVMPSSGKALDVPVGVSLDGKLARVGTSGFVVLFYPGGGSTGANLPFRYRGQTFELRVNWLTGHADVRRS